MEGKTDSALIKKNEKNLLLLHNITLLLLLQASPLLSPKGVIMILIDLHTFTLAFICFIFNPFYNDPLKNKLDTRNPPRWPVKNFHYFSDNQINIPVL